MRLNLSARQKERGHIHGGGSRIRRRTDVADILPTRRPSSGWLVRCSPNNTTSGRSVLATWEPNRWPRPG
jgi:hypothetical protein